VQIPLFKTNINWYN